MGIAISSNTQGINNINAFVSQKVGNEKLQTLAGLFANINLDGAPMLRGVFGETSILGNSLSVSYAKISSYGVNLHTSLRVNLFKNDEESYDFNVFGNEMRLLGDAFRVSRFGGNLNWNCSTGHMMAIGVSHSHPFRSTTIEASIRVNIWKSETGSSRFDISSNITHFIRGPLEGHQDVVATLTFSHAF